MSNPLSEDELLLWQMLEEEMGVDKLIDFVPAVSPWLAKPNHLRPLAALFWRASKNQKVRALTSTPPQHGKTTSMLHWIVWYLRHYPSQTVAYVTYEANLAHSKSKYARDIAERAGLKFSTSSYGAREWRTKQGGGVIATGIGGPLTGQRVDLMVIDDPIKNRTEAESPAKQRNMLDWARSTAFTRLSAHGSVIINMARWTPNDLIGRLSKEEDITWDVMNLPAVLDAGTPKERALWPEDKPLPVLYEKRRMIGEYDWSAMYEGRPRPRGGAMFRDPVFYTVPNLIGARYAIACDPAASTRNYSDHSAIVVMAATGDGSNQKAYVVEAWRGRVEIPQLCDILRQTQRRWGCPIFVEATGGFKAVAQILRSISARRGDTLRVVEIPPVGDKFTRALPAAAAWNSGDILVPDPSLKNPWLTPLLDELAIFTGQGDKEDDQVDALVHAFSGIDRRVSPIERGVKSMRAG